MAFEADLLAAFQQPDVALHHELYDGSLTDDLEAVAELAVVDRQIKGVLDVPTIF